VTDQWLSLEEAAQQLGVSVHAVRRRLKRGDIAARQVSTRYGPAWQVSLNGAVTLAQDSREPDASVSSPLREPNDRLSGLVGLVERQQRQIVDNASAAAMWQARAEMLAGELAAAREQLALMAPKVEPQAEAEHVFSTAVEETPPAPPRRPWYQRLLFG
jgi:predicted ArsR family transcriptional regulator